MKIKPHHVFALALMGAPGAWAAEGANASLGSFNSSLAPLSLHHFHIYFKPPAPEAIAAARNLSAESSGDLQFSSGMGQTSAQFYQDIHGGDQSIELLAKAQLPKADMVLRLCRAFEDGARVDPGQDAKDIFVKWRVSSPLNLTWQKEWHTHSVISVSMVEKPSFGTYKVTGDDSRGDNLYTYIPPSPEFTGKDRFSFLVKLSNGKSVLMRYQMEPGIMDHSFYNQGCVFATRLGQTQLSSSELKGLVSDPSSWLRSSQLSALLATASESFAGFSDLQGSAVGTTVGEGSSAQIALDPTAAGHGWYIDPTPLDNTDDYLPTSNPNIWQAKAGSEAAGKMDMLSVLLHEYGHALGLEHSADSGDYMAATLQPGQRRMPSADELTLMSQLVAQLKASTALADGSAPNSASSDPSSPTLPNPSLPLGALMIGRLALGRKPEDEGQGSQALFSANPTLQGGNLSTLQDWATQGSVVASGAAAGAPTGATLSETGATQTRLNQVFMVGPQDRFLSFTLSNLSLDDATNGPDDAFEAALLNANTGADLLSSLALSHTDALLNLQAGGNNGLAELAAQGVTHVTHADGSRTYLVDLSGIARDADGTVAVNLSFDLIGFGTTAASMGSHVQVSDVRLLGLPQAMDDSFSGAEDNTRTLNALANDTDAVQSGFAPVVVAGPAHGSISVNADGSFSYTADANYFGADSFTYPN